MSISTTTFIIRPIEVKDSEIVAQIIRQVMTEFDCVGEGYSILDPELENMYAAYDNDRSIFYVLESKEKVVGCGGIAPLEGGAGDTCELKKMYFLSEARGRGQGKRFLKTCLEGAKKLGYQKCYLETVERMEVANHLYCQMGFQKLCGAIGNTGHGSCDAYYVLDLS